MKVNLIIFFIFFSIVNASASVKDKIIQNLKTTKNLTFNFEQNINGKTENGYCTLSYPKKIFCKYNLKNNKIFGIGPRGFRYFCRSVNYNPEIGVCSTHPHNYFIQILSELGIIGILFYFLFLIFISLKLLSKKINNYSLVVKNQFYIISIGLILNLFPFIPSGNFFNNWLSLMTYFNLGLYLYTYKKIF